MEVPAFALQQEAVKGRMSAGSFAIYANSSAMLNELRSRRRSTDQLEDFKKVQVGVEDVLDLLQPLLAQGAHGVANSVQAHAAGEDDEALEQGLAAGDVFELQVWDAIGELAVQKKEKKSEKERMEC